MIRHGAMEAVTYPRVIGVGGAPKVGKTRWIMSSIRAVPQWFGRKGIYVEIDPDGAGSALPQDRRMWEKITVDPKNYIGDEIAGIIQHDWKKEGFDTVFIDTGSMLGQTMLTQIASKSLFGNNIDVGGVKQPTMGDYTGVDTGYFKLLRLQDTVAKATGMNFITSYHDLEIHPEPGKAGEVTGGPMIAGKAMTKKVVGWYNCYMRVAFKPIPRGGNLSKPQEYARTVFTQTNGIWLAGVRNGFVVNPHPEIPLGDDPAAAWETVASFYESEHPNG